MTRYISILLIFYSTVSFAQKTLDTLKIDAALRSYGTSNTPLQIVDPRIIQTIHAIDKNINSIVQSKTTWNPKKFTVIEGGSISIRQLVDKKEAIKVILSDTIGTIPLNYKSYWDEIGHDTTKFLSGMLTQSEFDLHYPNYQYPKLLTTINPLTFQQQLDCYRILFYSKQLDLTVDSLAKTISKKLQPNYYHYLSASIDHFWPDRKKVESRAIRILTITFGAGNIVYSGVDIYDTHYLLAFDTSNSWQLESIKTLWTY